jgi:hypothetical protein
VLNRVAASASVRTLSFMVASCKWNLTDNAHLPAMFLFPDMQGNQT